MVEHEMKNFPLQIQGNILCETPYFGNRDFIFPHTFQMKFDGFFHSP